MNVYHKYLLFQLLIVAAFLLGHRLKERFKSPGGLSSRLVYCNLIFIEPVIALWSIWGLRLSADYALLPAGGLLLVLGGFAAGYLLLPLLKLDPLRRTTFLISSTLANHGFTMGGFICYIFFGEKGLGLAVIFCLYFNFYVYGVVFPFAGFHSLEKISIKKRILSLVINVRNMPIYATIIALVLNSMRFERPSISFPIDTLLMVSISIYYFSLGLNFDFVDMRNSIRETIALAAIKFVLVPFAALGVLSLIRIDTDVRSVIAIQAFMPAAVYSVVSSILFRLDSRLASGMFVLNTIAFMLIILPLLLIFGGAVTGR